jgi:50S ribosomal protein L16 3-hydroxylase
MSRIPAIEVRAGKGRPLGMPPTVFLRDYWQKRPLLIRRAFAGFRNPVAPEDLAGLACEELALSRIAIHEPKRDRWTLRTGPFAEGDFSTLPKTHWTLLVQDVDKWDADVAALLGHFSFLPSWRVDDVMISYAEDGGSVGAHVDQYDVFLLQGLGRRRWEIDTSRCGEKSAQGCAGSCEGFAYRDDVELKLLREFTATHDWILEPGDMLYLPPGMPHHGVALGACMTYSIGMRAPSQADLLGDFVDHLIEGLPEEARYADADLAPARGDGEIDDAAIARVVQAMPWLKLDAPVAVATLRAWFGRFITRYRSAQLAAPPPRRLSDAMFLRAMASGASVRRNPWSRCAWMREGRAAMLFVAGEGHACSLSLARTAGTLDEFPLASGTTRDGALLRQLIDAGHYVLVHPRRSGNGR